LIVATGDCAAPFDGDSISIVIEVRGGHFCNHWPWFQKVRLNSSQGINKREMDLQSHGSGDMAVFRSFLKENDTLQQVVTGV
jgi:hypothetical protein